MSALPAPQGPAQCPACGAALPKMPQRKTKCRACGQFMYVRSSPSDRTRRLMTADAMAESEAAWAAYGAAQEVDRQAMLHGLDAKALQAATIAHGGDLQAALRATLRPLALAGDYKAVKAMVSLSRLPDDLLLWKRTRLRMDLEAWRGVPQPGYRLVGLGACKPDPDPVTVAVLALHDAGESNEAISMKLGYHIETVSRIVDNRHDYPLAGRPCDALCALRLSFDDALRDMPLPCGPYCVCIWTAHFVKVNQTVAEPMRVASEPLPDRSTVPAAASKPKPWWQRILGKR